MTGPKLSSFAPDIPAVAETLLGYQSTLWYALLAPKGTPQPILNRLHDDTIKALRSKDVVQQLESQSAEGVGNRPQEMQKFIQSKIAPWTRLAKQVKMTLD